MKGRMWLWVVLLGIGWVTGCAGNNGNAPTPTPMPVSLLFFYTDN